MTSPVWLSLNGGVSMIRRGGEAYVEAGDKSAEPERAWILTGTRPG